MMYEGFHLFEKRKPGAYLIRQNGVIDCFFKQPVDGICKMQSRKAKTTFKYSAKLVKTLMVHSQYNQTHITVAATSTACKESIG